MQSLFNHIEKKLGGLNNKNYLLNYYGKKYVLKIKSSKKTNFKNEHEVITLINTLSISPKIIYHSKFSGTLLSEYLEDSSLSFNVLKSEAFLKAISKTLNKLHKAPSTSIASFNPFLEIDKNIDYLTCSNFKFNHKMDKLLEKKQFIENNYLKDTCIGFCHNDLNSSNILFKNQKAYLIDFEFSGTGPIFFDLATLSWFLNQNEKNILLKEYLKKPLLSKEDLLKLEDYLFIVKLWNATWSFKKSLSSTGDYDYKLGGNLILDDLQKNLLDFSKEKSYR